MSDPHQNDYLSKPIGDAPRVRKEAAASATEIRQFINGLRGKFGQSNYAASKAGLIGFARSLSLGIDCSVIACGMRPPRQELVAMRPSLYFAMRSSSTRGL